LFALEVSRGRRIVAMKNTNRREFLQLMGMGAMASTLHATIAKALGIPANNRTRSIRDVEHIVILMQENRPFDHHFGTLRGVRGYNDPRAVNIHLPLQSGTGTTLASVFLQPAGAANVAAGYGVPAGSLGGPADGVAVIPPFRVNPQAVSSGLSVGLTYLPGTNHAWGATHDCWNLGQYDSWASVNGPMTMSYMTREDIPYHYALADAFTVGDAYHCSIMGPTNPNRTYLWTGCIGNLDSLGSGGTDGHGAGPMTGNGLSPNNAYWTFPTFPEVLQSAGVSWKIYQDLAGATFAPDFGDGTSNSFVGNFTDNPVLYFNQYANAAPGTPLFDNACTGTGIINTIPSSSAPAADWKAWQEHLFDQFRSDVQNGKLPQVSWIVAPAGYTEHSDFPIDYGAWYISQVLDILVSNPEVFSKTVLIINYDEGDGSFDHLTPPFPPQSPAYGASTVDFHNEIVTTSTPNGPIGLGTRVPLVVISPWTKGGYVNSQVFDHTSVIQFIEKRFGVVEANISPWRRAVAGDLTSMFNFEDPDDPRVNLPSTDGYLPPVKELSGGNVNTFTPAQSQVIPGVPQQEKGIRPARALPYELHAHGRVNVSNKTFGLEFHNTGSVGAAFQVRSGNAADTVRMYTVEPGKKLTGTWSVVASYYDLSVYGPNGFARYFKGSIGAGAAALEVNSSYGEEDGSSIRLDITNIGTSKATVILLNAYTGDRDTRLLQPGETLEDNTALDRFHGWYDLIVKVMEDPTFECRFAGHVETSEDSFSDPALGGLVTLKA
jgi:phospholipase C